jgi:HD superfamily phosphodiesterase
MKYIKKLELSDEMFTEKEKKILEKNYELGNDYYNAIEKNEDKKNS